MRRSRRADESRQLDRSRQAQDAIDPFDRKHGFNRRSSGLVNACLLLLVLHTLPAHIGEVLIEQPGVSRHRLGRYEAPCHPSDAIELCRGKCPLGGLKLPMLANELVECIPQTLAQLCIKVVRIRGLT